MAIEIDNDNNEIRIDGYEYALSKVNAKTYSISSQPSQAGNSADLRLLDSDGYTDDVTFTGGSNVSIVRTNPNVITISANIIDANTTYSISTETSATPKAAILRLSGSDSTTDDITVVGGTNVNVVRTDQNTLTINSSQPSFLNISDGNNTAVADAPNDTLTLTAGSGIGIAVAPLTDTVTISNTGVTAITPGTAITTSGSGNVTVNNDGVTTFNGVKGAITYNSFGTISDGNNSAVADQANDTFTITAGTGIGAIVNAAGDSVTISNSGVTQAVAGTGISVSAGTGSVTIGNTGVTAITAGTGITTSGTGNVTINNNGVTSFNGSGGAITYNNFTNLTDGVNTATPDGTADTFTFTGGSGINAIINAGTDTLTISLKESSVIISPATVINTNSTSAAFTVNGVGANAAIEFQATLMVKFSGAGANNSYDAILATSGTFTNAAASVAFGPSTMAEITSVSTFVTSPVLNDANVHILNVRGVIHNGGTVANVGLNIKNNSGINTLSILAKSIIKYNFI